MLKNLFKGEYVTDFLIVASLVVTLVPGLSDMFRMTGHFDYTMFTTTLVHASVKGHWLNNMVFIAFLGPAIEARYGSGRLLVMCMLTSMTTSLIASWQNVCGVGMSDIVFMFIILHCFCRKAEGISFTCLVLIATQLMPELTQIANKDGIGHDAHLIGGVLGLVFGFVNNAMEKWVNNLPVSEKS